MDCVTPRSARSMTNTATAVRPPTSGEASFNGHRIHVIQGEQHVADDPDVMLTTILGSCVSACLRDPIVGVGGMNHFLLPGGNGSSDIAIRGGGALRYGVHAMELLVNGLLQRGAQRIRLEAKLFGGARMMNGLTDIGEMNASFAEKFLQNEGVALIGGSLRGAQGRRIQFWPVSGRARQIMLSADNEGAFRKENRPMAMPITSSGEVDLF